MLLHTANSTNTELLTIMYNQQLQYYNYNKTIFKILMLTTAANVIYTAKAEF